MQPPTTSVRDPTVTAAANAAARSVRGGTERGGGFFAFGHGGKKKEARSSVDSAAAGVAAARVSDVSDGSATAGDNPFGDEYDEATRPRSRTPFDDPPVSSLHPTGVSSDCLLAADALFSNRSSRASVTAEEAATATAAAAAAEAAGQLFGTTAQIRSGFFPGH